MLVCERLPVTYHDRSVCSLQLAGSFCTGIATEVTEATEKLAPSSVASALSVATMRYRRGESWGVNDPG